MFGLCKYKDILGVPGDKQYTRFLGVRVRDVILLFIGTFLLSLLTKVKFWKMLIYILILMVFVHHIFCVRTTTDKILFPDDEENFDTIRFTLFIFISLFIIYLLNIPRRT